MTQHSQWEGDNSRQRGDGRSVEAGSEAGFLTLAISKAAQNKCLFLRLDLLREAEVRTSQCWSESDSQEGAHSTSRAFAEIKCGF